MATDRRLADAMAGYWTAFAIGGNPDGPGRPVWPTFTKTDERVLVLGDTIETGRLPNGAALDVFESVYQSIR
ncbi:hypothetical protein D3C73_1509590 [compost metagenome]